jgi:hypothetical protein
MKIGEALTKQWRGPALVLVALLALVLLAAPPQLRAAGDNVVVNPGFESGTQAWACKICALTVVSPGQEGANAGQMRTTKRTGRAQLTQSNITLQPNTEYEFSFWAKSDGKDLQVDLARQNSPFTNYGLNRTFDLTTEWQQFTVNFTTQGFSGGVTNARLRFRAPKGNGLVFQLDAISLVPQSDPPDPPDGDAMLIYDWNKPITQAEGGFAMDKTSQFLSQNWETPINYADGTLYFRARIHSIPVNQPGMKLGFCFWQSGGRENCKGNDVPGVPGTDVTWSFSPHSMWKKNGTEIDWSAPRTKMGFSVRDGQNDPVSNKTSDDWGGNNPADWYPMNLRFQVVLVPQGGTFPGWDAFP